MAQYNALNVRLSNSQLNKWKAAVENGIEVTLNLLTNLIDNYNDEIDFLKLLQMAAQLT